MPQAIAARIVEKGGDYLLAVQGNQSRPVRGRPAFSSTIRPWQGPA
jgi:hypothetical protein